MNKIIWMGDRFECSNSDLENAKREVLSVENKRMHEFMEACDLPMNGYSYDAEWNITIHHSIAQNSLPKGLKAQRGEPILIPIAEEGTGFNICFHLGAYAIASMDLGQKLEICAYSFKGLLHPLLFEHLGKWFGDRRAEEIDKKCSYYSGDFHLKCAINPSLPCNKCDEASASFRESLFVWLAQPLPDWKGKSRLTINELRVLTDSHLTGVGISSGQDAVVITSIERVGRSDISIGISGDASQIQEAIAAIRARVGGILDRNFLEAYQCGLSDRIAPLTPLPPRFEEEHQRYTEERRRARILSHFEEVVVYPQPHRMPIPQELYGVLGDTEVNLSSQLGMSPEEVAEHKANGTLFAELHRRSQLKRANRVNDQQEDL